MPQAKPEALPLHPRQGFCPGSLAFHSDRLTWLSASNVLAQVLRSEVSTQRVTIVDRSNC